MEVSERMRRPTHTNRQTYTYEHSHSSSSSRRTLNEEILCKEGRKREGRRQWRPQQRQNFCSVDLIGEREARPTDGRTTTTQTHSNNSEPPPPPPPPPHQDVELRVEKRKKERKKRTDGLSMKKKNASRKEEEPTYVCTVCVYAPYSTHHLCMHVIRGA